MLSTSARTDSRRGTKHRNSMRWLRSRAPVGRCPDSTPHDGRTDRKSTRLNSSHANISYAVFCLKKKKTNKQPTKYKKKKGASLHTLGEVKANVLADVHYDEITRLHFRRSCY